MEIQESTNTDTNELNNMRKVIEQMSKFFLLVHINYILFKIMLVNCTKYIYCYGDNNY